MKSKKILLMFFFCFYTSIILGEGVNKSAKKVLKLMGTRFEIIAISENENTAWQGVEAGIKEISRIEKLISSWDKDSQTSEINRQAGIKPVKVDVELFELIRRSKKISKLTNGIFDISFASLDKVWKYDGSMKRKPTEEEMFRSVSKINYENIILDEKTNSVFLKETGMKIGLGAIGKGYAANCAKKIMIELGINNGVVNAAGDLIAWGKQADGKDWSVGITDPNDKEKNFGWLAVSETSIATSGNYEKFVEFDGISYGHIIHPKTGIPVSGLKSVTIVCPDAELADALATSVFILGEIEGLDLINKLNGIEAIIVNNKNEIKISDNLKLNYYN